MEYPDPVRRVAEEMNFHATVIASGDGYLSPDGTRGYAVFNLSDGTPVTHHVYPSRADARRHAEKLTRDLLLILEVQPGGMPLNEADAVLNFERSLASAGYRTPDSLETPEHSGILSVPRTQGDRNRHARQLLAGKPLYHPGISYGNLPSHRKVT